MVSNPLRPLDSITESAKGLMGMGFQSISEYNASPVFQSLVSQGQTTDSVFAFKLADQGAELSIGGLNQDLYTGNVSYIPVTEEGYWQVEMDSVNVESKAVVTGVGAIIDSGTTVSFFWRTFLATVRSRRPLAHRWRHH
jgi:cathepsin D